MLGWYQEVQQAPQGIALVTAVDDLEELAEQSRRGGLERRVQRRQQVLDGALQGFEVLKRAGRGFAFGNMSEVILSL